MGEILFRGKRKDNGEWVEGGIIPFKIPVIVTTIYEEDAYGDPQVRICRFDVIPETVGQYTGLTDKLGVKIFDGDILEQYGMHYVVSFEDGTFVAYETPYNEGAVISRYDWQFALKVGNIHDNPELLKRDESKSNSMRDMLIESIDNFIYTVDVNHWYSEELDEQLADHLIEDGWIKSCYESGRIEDFWNKLKTKFEESKYKVYTDTHYARGCNDVVDSCIVTGDNLVKEMEDELKPHE